MKNNLIFNYSLRREDKESQNNHSSIVVWFFGLSGSGKSTLCNSIEKSLFLKKINTVILDGDTLRNGLNNDLNFSEEDRNENIRRVSETSKILLNNGVVTLCSFITPLEKNRDLVNSIIGRENILWVFVDTPLDICSKRDTKGLYKLAEKGEIDQFTGVSSLFENPSNVDFISDYKENIKHVTEILSNLILKKIHLNDR
jgi:adenylylsulfate kinase